MWKNVLFLVLITNLIAEIEVDVQLIKNDSSYKLENKDIVFKGDKLKFYLKSKQDKLLRIHYKINNDNYKIFKEVKLYEDKLLEIPSSNEYIVLDEQQGTLSFLFQTDNYDKKFTLITNPKTKEIFKKEKNIKNNRVYIDKTKVISNSRGVKESNTIIPKLESSTVIISVNNKIGTGVIINNGKNILTNYHVIEPNKNKIFIAFKPKLGNKPSKNNYYKVNLEKVDMSRDLALLSLPKNLINKQKYSFLKLASDESLKKGIDIYNIGHPLGYYFAFEYGMLTNILNDYKWTTYQADYVLQYSMNSNKGNSGSPIVNDKLELIGIGAFSNKKGKNLNFGISIIDIKKFLDSKESVIVKNKNPNEYKNSIVEEGLYKNIKLAKLDRNNNGVLDAMMKDIDNDGIWDIIAYDTDEDGSFERVTSF